MNSNIFINVKKKLFKISSGKVGHSPKNKAGLTEIN